MRVFIQEPLLQSMELLEIIGTKETILVLYIVREIGNLKQYVYVKNRMENQIQVMGKCHQMHYCVILLATN